MKKSNFVLAFLFMIAIGASYANNNSGKKFLADSDQLISASCNPVTSGCSETGQFLCQSTNIYRLEAAPANRCTVKLTKRTTPAP